MKKSEFKDLIKLSFLEMLEKDTDFQHYILEFLLKNKNIISEQVTKKEIVQENYNKEPINADLYDELCLVACGKKGRLIYENKSIKCPNYGVGYKSSAQIKEWVDKVYTKLGGKWKDAFLSENNNAQSNLNQENIDPYQEDLSDKLLKEDIKNKISTSMFLDENFNRNNSFDITDILVDTAKTTYKNFPKEHGSANGEIVKEQESFKGTPEQVFGEDSALIWSKLAF